MFAPFKQKKRFPKRAASVASIEFCLSLRLKVQNFFEVNALFILRRWSIIFLANVP